MTPIRSHNETAEPSPETRNPEACVLGDGALGDALHSRLAEDGLDVARFDGTLSSADETAAPAVDARWDPPIDSAGTAIVATASDARNLLVAQRLRARCDVDRVVVVTNSPDRVDAIAAAGHDPLCATTVLADALADRV